jgi:hypothetical protein
VAEGGAEGGPQLTAQYLSITPLQEPFDLQTLDDSGRCVWACNFVTFKRPSASFLQEIVAVLVAAGVGVAGVSIFAGSLAVLPDPTEYAGPILFLKATGGVGPVGTHNDGAGAYRRPGFEIFTHASTTPAAEAMAEAAYSALIGVRNQAVSA